ncbi:MAG TPA: LytTR family DNA-binding domain-containing protein [Flavisolibacter sp.]|jgi:DNA-binding LytR/AlgR family response regulator|nr:LytTR family DNA-binding domain-containing protein [Flavisolibacter sp.]
MTVLLAEDEQIAAKHLINLLDEVGFTYDALEHVRSVEELRQWLGNNPEPDLMLLDIQLKDGVSLQIFDELKISTPVIFITAYDEYAIKSFKANSLNYLLKPLDKDALRKALDKYTEIANFYQHSPGQVKGEKKERIVVKKGVSRLSVPINSIAFFYAEMKLTFAVDFEGSRYLLDYNLSQVEQQLDKKVFFRVSRQIIANINAIKEFKSVEFSKIELYLAKNNYIKDSIIISQFTAPDFKKWINNL